MTYPMLLQITALQGLQAFNNFVQRDFILQIYLIVEFGAEPVLMRLPILRHQNDGGLEDGEHVNRSTKQQVGIRIEANVKIKSAVYQHPQAKEEHSGCYEFPTAAKLRDDVRGPVCKCTLRGFLHIDIPRHAMTQKLISVSQSVGECSEQFQRDIRAAAHERKKMLARKYSQPGIFRDDRIRGAPLSVE